MPPPSRWPGSPASPVTWNRALSPWPSGPAPVAVSAILAGSASGTYFPPSPGPNQPTTSSIACTRPDALRSRMFPSSAIVTIDMFDRRSLRPTLSAVPPFSAP